MMTQNKEITIEDTPEAVAGRLPGFCATNAEGIGITVEEEPAPRGLIYFRVHCGDKKAASARLELRTLRGDCVIGWGWRHGLTRLGKPGNREDLQRCKDFCTGFLAHIAANDAPAPAVAVLTSTDAEIRELCVAWAARGILTPRLSEFLEQHQKTGGRYLTVDDFKAMLRDGGKRRWIKKVKNRWRPAS